MLELEKMSPKVVALVEVLALAAYIAIFALVALNVGALLADSYSVPPFIHLVIFLTAFVFSALVCGSLVLGYPALLIFKGKSEVAVRIILWCICWLAFFGIFFVVLAAVFASAR